MKKIPVEQAVGMALCHDITAMRDGFKGAAFRRGHVIRPEDVAQLLDLGKRTVFVWRTKPGRSMKRTPPGVWPLWRRWKALTTRNHRRERCCCWQTGRACFE